MIYAGHFTLRIIRAVLAIFSLAVLHARAETLATHPSVHPLPHAIGLPAGSAGIYEGVITGARDARGAIKTCGPQEQWDDMRRSLHANLTVELASLLEHRCTRGGMDESLVLGGLHIAWIGHANIGGFRAEDVAHVYYQLPVPPRSIAESLHGSTNARTLIAPALSAMAHYCRG